MSLPNQLEMLNEKEKKIRTLWLISYLVSAVIGLLTSILTLTSFKTVFRSTAVVSVTIATHLLIFFGIGYLFYHCSYKRYGLRWITCSLVLTPLFMVFSPISLIQNSSAFTPLAYYLSWFSWVLSIGYYILTFKLRKINKKIRLKSL